MGCPCDSFDCQPEKKSVLVLYSNQSNEPVLIEFDGKYIMNWDLRFIQMVEVVFKKISTSPWGQTQVLRTPVRQYSMVNYLFLVVMVHQTKNRWYFDIREIISSKIHFRLVRLSAVNWNIWENSEVHFILGLVEPFHLMPKNELCYAFNTVLQRNAPGHNSRIYCLN